MDGTLRILILEDSPADAELVEFELKEAGFVFTARRVKTQKDYVRELGKFCPDVILSDYDLPQYNGALALAEAQKTCPETPFILVSGAVSEDLAIEILTQGAKDYVLKTKLRQRLATAVRRALEEAAEQKARKAAEQKLRELHDSLERQIAERTAELQNQITHRRNAEEVLLKYNERLEIMSYTAGRLLVSDKPRQIVEELCRKVMIFLDCEAFFNFLVDEAAGRLRLNAYAGIPPETAQQIEWLDFGTAVCGCVAQDGLRIIAENIPETPDIRTELIKSFGIKAYACHPLLQQNRVIGTLSFGTRTRSAFSQDDLAMMKAVADQVAIAISRVRMEASLRESEQRYRELVQSSPEAVIVHSDGRFLYANPAALELYGAESLRRLQSKTFHDLISDDERSIPAGIHQEKAGEKTPLNETRLMRLDGKIIPVESVGGAIIYNGQSAVQVIIRDITERKNREKEREKHNRTLRALSKSNQAMMRAVDEFQYLKDVCKIVVDDCGYSMVWIGYADDNGDKTVRPVAFSGFEAGYIDALKITWNDTGHGLGPTGRAIRSGQTAICRNMTTDPLYKPWKEEALRRGYASSIALPLLNANEVFGALNIYSKDPDPFTMEEEKLLAELANDLSYGIAAIRLREALRESEERFHAVATHTPDHILMQDGQLRYQLVINPQLGLSEADMLGRTDSDILSAEDAEKLTAIKRRVLETGNPYSLETSVASKHGEVGFFEGAYVPRMDSAGRAEGIIGYFRNVTERKRIEEAIVRAKEEWERTFDTVPDLIAILDNRHRIVRVNKAMADRLKDLPENCVGKACHEAVHGLPYPPSFCPHSLTCTDSRQHLAEIHEPCLGGDFLVSTTPLCDGAGQLVGSVHVARDITERKLAENHLAKQAAELRERTAQMEELNHELESFSYSVSHDLRAPLRAIDGFSRKFERDYSDKVDEKGMDTIRVIRNNAKLMGILIDSLLSFSRVQKTSMSIASIDMAAMAGDVWKEIRSANKNRKLTFKAVDILPAAGDRTLVRQVLINLLGNAAKFTRNKKQGIIEMNSYPDGDKIVYCIKDNGAGFDMEYGDKLFGVFQRLHSQEEYEGTGVGLAIVQRIILRHGGKIWAHGALDKGATFCFTLPQSIAGKPDNERSRP